MQPRIPASTLLICLLFTVTSWGQTPESAFNRDPWPASKSGPVKVFILAGQSNMQGHASLRTLEYLIYNEETAADYQHWKDVNGGWNERRDVWVWTTDGQRHGNLKPGFGANEMKIGPELGFGWVIGEHLDEQVLLIKTCWGGRSLRRHFRPPGAEPPTEEQLATDLENAQKRNPEATLDDVKAGYGRDYRNIITHVNDVLGGLDELFPAYDTARGYELSGLVWFQGWNDMVDRQQRDEAYRQYTVRLAQLIRDLRAEFDAPELPVVIGELGANGNRGEFQSAQRAVAELPDLKQTVRFVETVEFWEPDVAKLVDEGVWKGPDWVKFYNVGSDRGYHYLGSSRIMTRMGRAFGKGMIQLLDDRSKTQSEQ